MKIEYDQEADAAYIYFEYPLKDGAVKDTRVFNDDIIIDYDAQKKVIGIEILNASKQLKKEFLKTLLPA